MDKAQRLSVLDDLIKLETVNGNEEIVANYLKNLFEQNGIAKSRLLIEKTR